MKTNKKLSLNDLKVESFITNLQTESFKTIKGGSVIKLSGNKQFSALQMEGGSNDGPSECCRTNQGGC